MKRFRTETPHAPLRRGRRLREIPDRWNSKAAQEARARLRALTAARSRAQPSAVRCAAREQNSTRSQDRYSVGPQAHDRSVEYFRELAEADTTPRGPPGEAGATEGNVAGRKPRRQPSSQRQMKLHRLRRRAPRGAGAKIGRAHV